MAEKLGVSRQTVCNYESDKCRPSSETWKKIVSTLELKGEEADRDKFFRKRQSIRKYGTKDKCKHPGCDRRAESRGFCMPHYVCTWRREKKAKERANKDASV
jgi:DNA-binding XRE family transcriptional regulator